MFSLWLSHPLVWSLLLYLLILLLLDSAAQVLVLPLKRCVCVCVCVCSFHLSSYYYFFHACSDLHIELEWLRCLRHRNYVITWFLKDWLTKWWMKREACGFHSRLETKTQTLSSCLFFALTQFFFIQWQLLKRMIYTPLHVFIYYYSLTLYNIAFVLIILLILLLSICIYPFCHIQ